MWKRRGKGEARRRETIRSDREPPTRRVRFSRVEPRFPRGGLRFVYTYTNLTAHETKRLPRGLHYRPPALG